MKARVERISATGMSRRIETAFLSPRRELRGWATAAVVEVPAPWRTGLHRVSEFLDAIELDVEGNGADPTKEAGVGPIAFGALPFDSNAPARFVIPSVITALNPDGALWRTTIDGADAALADAALADRATPEPAEETQSLRLQATLSPAEWMQRIETALEHIATSELVKVVLARRLLVDADVPIDAAALAARIFDAQPQSLRFAIDGFIGASPELLVSRLDDVVRAQPMAGTTARSGDPTADARGAAALLASAKNRAEHRITIDAVHDALLPWCSYLDAEPEPHVAPAGSVAHLATLVEGRLSRPVPTVVELVAALHPTPAVGGWPREAATELITTLEGADRGRYAGPVGWVDRHGNGAFAVGIRSVELSADRRRATLHAGVGVVADSDPAAELAETRAKFRATLPALFDL